MSKGVGLKSKPSTYVERDKSNDIHNDPVGDVFKVFKTIQVDSRIKAEIQLNSEDFNTVDFKWIFIGTFAEGADKWGYGQGFWLLTRSRAMICYVTDLLGFVPYPLSTNTNHRQNQTLSSFPLFPIEQRVSRRGKQNVSFNSVSCSASSELT